MIELGVNIDHIATLRQARKTYEPDPVQAAAEAELGGADGITIHLREDRRHIIDRDVHMLKHTVQIKLNLEMSLATEIVDIAIDTAPEQATLVPEKREEVTTEGGLDMFANAEQCAEVVKRLQAVGTKVSAFIDPVNDQVEKAKELGFDAVELHTGAYANARGEEINEELSRLICSGEKTVEFGMRLHAGHGLNYHNTLPVASIPQMMELNIGHAIISRCVFIGLRKAVRQMRQLIDKVGCKD